MENAMRCMCVVSSVQNKLVIIIYEEIIFSPLKKTRTGIH